MLFGEIVIVALQSIRANLFRAILTMLGILIGVGAVITMLAAGAGAQKRIDDQIAALGSNILTVNAAQFFAGGISRDRQTLVVDDVDALIADNRYLDAVVPEMQNRGQLKLENMNTNTRLIGTTADYAQVFNYKIAHGRFFTPEEDELRSRVVVLGADIPERLEVEADKLVGRSMSTIARSIDASCATRTLMLSICLRPKTRCSAVLNGITAAKSGLWLPKPPPMLSKTPMIWNGWPLTAIVRPTSLSASTSSRSGMSWPSTTTRLRSSSSSGVKKRPCAIL